MKDVFNIRSMKGSIGGMMMNMRTTITTVPVCTMKIEDIPDIMERHPDMKV